MISSRKIEKIIQDIYQENAFNETDLMDLKQRLEIVSTQRQSTSFSLSLINHLDTQWKQFLITIAGEYDQLNNLPFLFIEDMICYFSDRICNILTGEKK